MPKQCVVPKCETGRKGLEQKYSLFKVPRNIERVRKWQVAIPNVILKKSQYVCERHFKSSDIVRQWTGRDANGTIIAQTAYQRPRLDESAVPTIFDNSEAMKLSTQSLLESQDELIEHIVETAQSSQFCDTDMEGPTSINVAKSITAQSLLEIILPEESNCLHEDSVCFHAVESSRSEFSQQLSPLPPPEIHLQQAFAQPVINPLEDSMVEEVLSPKKVLEQKNLQTPDAKMMDCSTVAPRSRNIVFSDIKVIDDNVILNVEENFSINIPKFWCCKKLSTDKDKSILFAHFESKRVNEAVIPVIERSVMIDTDNRLQYSFCGHAVDVNNFKLAEVLEEPSLLPITLETFGKMKPCSGLGAVNVHCLPADSVFKDSLDRWRDSSCTLLSKRNRCEGCKKTRHRIFQRELRSKNNCTTKRVLRASNPTDEKKLVVLRKKYDRERRLKRRAKQRVQLLLQSLRGKAEEIASISAETLEERCSALKSQISEAQKAVLTEIISAASKKSPNNHRYSEEWIMLCILMNIRSPGYYEFLRKNNVLPLPCKRTIRSYFSLVNMKCGFDKQFGQLLKKHFDSNSEQKRHGILLFDEINLRKSVTVCSKNLTYVGLTDFGDDGPQSKNIEDQATHGLVIMFQALADSFTQPIAVFASKNPVKGDELSKLVVKSISFMEENGAKIHGIIGDGAATNAKMRSQLGVSGEMGNTKTWFMHPLDDDRKVFVFSDTPHLVKCIRNRLYNKRKLRMNSTDAPISWDFFKSLYDLDTAHPGHARACPKLTQRHVVLDNTSKMRVRLATQIFSDSVAKGLAFYLSHKHLSLNGCEETIKFCTWINALFDALNRKSPNQGLTPETEDFKVLEKSLQMLNDWQTAVNKGEIAADDFLTPETSKGLRLSLQSTMDMCRYLIEKFNFQYLLTGKVNQDNLEKFFGTIRQAAGCNDHPNSPTFLQLYKVLSIYSIIKPPKFGNCTVADAPTPQILVSLSELKEIYNKESETKIAAYRREVQEKLDEVLRHHDWEADDVIEHNPDHEYTLSPSVDCIIYYVTGYLCKQVLQSYQTCTICERAVRSESPCTSSVSQLVDMKSRGGLIHANSRFFNLIRHVESCFAKNASRSDVFEFTLEEVLSSYNFTFPCTEHASKILSFAIVYYIRLRMRQYAHQENQRMTKKFVVQKKLSKLTNE